MKRSNKIQVEDVRFLEEVDGDGRRMKRDEIFYLFYLLHLFWAVSNIKNNLISRNGPF